MRACVDDHYEVENLHRLFFIGLMAVLITQRLYLYGYR